jgi:hypothetical protein
VILTTSMSSPSKAKGSGWERDVAKHLSTMYNEQFIRAPGSGAYVGGTNKSRKEFLHEGQIRAFKGDIIPGESFSKLNVECKFYKDFPFHQLLGSNEIKILEKWIEQLLDAADDGDFNILIMKFNHKGKYIATNASLDLAATRYVDYHSTKYGSWRIVDYDDFWLLNGSKVKELSQ